MFFIPDINQIYVMQPVVTPFSSQMAGRPMTLNIDDKRTLYNLKTKNGGFNLLEECLQQLAAF